MTLPADRIYLFDTSIWIRTKHPHTLSLTAHHRLPFQDALIAATAARQNVGVLHYDGHFDTLSKVLGFESRWVAAPGSL